MTEAISIVQAITTLLLTFITWQYVRHTKQLVQLNVEPRIDIEIPDDSLESSLSGKIINLSACEVEDISIIVSALYSDADGNISPIKKCIEAISHKGVLKPKKHIKLNVKDFFSYASLSKAKSDLPENLTLLDRHILIAVSYRRSADSRLFAFHELYQTRIEDNKVLIAKAAPRQKVDSIEAPIIKRAK